MEGGLVYSAYAPNYVLSFPLLSDNRVGTPRLCRVALTLSFGWRINLKELAMAYAIRSTINWLDRKGTQALAEELVNDFADGTANDVLAKILTEYKEGTRLERGKTVYIRNLIFLILIEWLKQLNKPLNYLFTHATPM